jgi:hypothetical protein
MITALDMIAMVPASTFDHMSGNTPSPDADPTPT